MKTVTLVKAEVVAQKKQQEREVEVGVVEEEEAQRRLAAGKAFWGPKQPDHPPPQHKRHTPIEWGSVQHMCNKRRQLNLQREAQALEEEETKEWRKKQRMAKYNDNIRQRSKAFLPTKEGTAEDSLEEEKAEKKLVTLVKRPQGASGAESQKEDPCNQQEQEPHSQSLSWWQRAFPHKWKGEWSWDQSELDQQTNPSNSWEQ